MWSPNCIPVKQQGGGQRLRRKRNATQTPPGVKKIASRLSNSGGHRSTVYKGGGIEKELVEAVLPEGASPGQVDRIRHKNRYARKNLMSSFNEEASVDTHLEKFPPGVSVASPPCKTDRHITTTYVGHGLCLQLKWELKQPNWTTREANNSRQRNSRKLKSITSQFEAAAPKGAQGLHIGVSSIDASNDGGGVEQSGVEGAGEDVEKVVQSTHMLSCEQEALRWKR